MTLVKDSLKDSTGVKTILSDKNCKCGKRYWEVSSYTTTATVCAYCRTIKFPNIVAWSSSLDINTVRYLLLAEYHLSINEDNKAEIMSIMLGDQRHVNI